MLRRRKAATSPEFQMLQRTRMTAIVGQCGLEQLANTEVWRLIWIGNPYLRTLLIGFE